MSKIDRRGLLRSAFHTSVAAMAPMEALAAMPTGATRAASAKSLGELAEVRRMVKQMIRLDARQAAAEEADDKVQHRKIEGKYRRVYRRFEKLRRALENRPPSCWVDVVTRAEIAGYAIVWDKPRTNWPALMKEVRSDCSAGYPGMGGLVAAILYLAAQGTSEQPEVGAA